MGELRAARGDPVPGTRIGGEFMPPLHEGTILFMPTTLPGVSVARAREILRIQDETIKRFPEVERVFGKLGRADSATDPAPGTSNCNCSGLRPFRGRSTMRRESTTSRSVPLRTSTCTASASTVTLSLTNHNRWLPSFSLRLFDVAGGHDLDRGLFVDHLPAQRSVLLSYPILATTRGRLHLDGVRAETLFPFGLFLKRALYQVPVDIPVSPAIRPLSLRFVDDLVSEGEGLSLPRRGHGMQLYNLRLYRPGDDSRSIHWMTTARTSKLIVRETEAEDQRRITIALSTFAPDDCDMLFEQSVMLVASLLWQLSQKSYPLRLIVHTEDSGLGSGSEHLLAMLRLLALCERRSPEAGHKAFADPLSGLTHDAERGYTVAVIPWTDPDTPLPLAADRILLASHIEALTHGA